MIPESLNEMTIQQACDYAVLKIVEQGEQALDDQGCCYATEDGKHCALGWLLDENNDKYMKTAGTIDVLLDNFKDLPEFFREHQHVLRALQRFHDACAMKNRMSNVQSVRGHGIDTTAPQWQQWVEMGTAEGWF